MKITLQWCVTLFNWNDWTPQSVIEMVGNQYAILFLIVQMIITYAKILVLRMSQLHCIILQELSNGLMKA